MELPRRSNEAAVSQAEPQRPQPTNGVLGLGERVCRYFLDFLESDFKRQQAPRRRIQGRTENGQPTSINLRKYRRFADEIWGRFSRPLRDGATFSVGRNSYTAQLNPVLQDLIRKHVAAIEDRLFDETVAAGMQAAQKGRAGATADIEKYVEAVLDAVGSALDKRIVAPLLALLDAQVRNQAASAIDSIYEIETDIVEALIHKVDEQLSSSLTAFVVDGDSAALEAMFRECLAPPDSRQRLAEYLESVVTADLFQDFRDLHNYFRTQETASFYLYVCDLRFGPNVYPLLYLPMQVEFEKEAAQFRCSLDPHLYVNKRAVDYVLRELGNRLGRLTITPIDDRIFYLDEAKPLLDEIERVVNRVQSVLNLDATLAVRSKAAQSASSSALKMSNALHIAVFDKSDESLLNDYEALLAAMHTNEGDVVSLFQRFVQGCILEDPVRTVSAVDAHWDGESIPVHLVARSPIPLNEEQRKLLVALRDPSTRFAVVQGPPGTGKSHTITAIAFDCILKGENVLVLSDKQEALDVVEDKLTATLQKVRLTDGFQNPILRLGRNNGTYTRLLSPTALDHIRKHHVAESKNEGKIDQEIEERDKKLKEDIGQTVELLSGVQLGDIEELEKLEREIEAAVPGLAAELRRKELHSLATCLGPVCQAAQASECLPAAEALLRTEFGGRSLVDFGLLLRVRTLLARASSIKDTVPLELFDGLDPFKEEVLGRFLAEYHALKMPVFGYLFRRRALSELNSRFLRTLPCEVRVSPEKFLAHFAKVLAALGELREMMGQLSLSSAAGPLCYNELRDGQAAGVDFAELLPVMSAAVTLLKALPEGTAGLLEPKALGSIAGLLELGGKLARYATLWQGTRSRLEAVPKFDAVASRASLENLYTQKMAVEIDRRFIQFVDNAHATARSLAGVIRSKKKFPTDSFGHLRSAFPCTIAGIREFAEYIPLQADLFDVVILDEASQVSVAQAFPALLRGKKVVVFGDPRQFSNVKSANASKALNQSYLSGIRSFFEEHVSSSADKLDRLSRFDVKRSILEFFELVANYEIMLRKHFRGYQELISFSSHTFYRDTLQAIKIRGKPLDEVIRFEVLEPGAEEAAVGYRNVNKAECEFIRGELDELLESFDEDGDDKPPTVGIITPFREQQQYLTRELFRNANAEHYESKLRLKIMTFDTCQGEERDIIFYSMVATAEHDALNYVFPVALDHAEDRVGEEIKMQRLNVGFSRAKEEIHFVLSKPIDQYRGAIGRVLTHYQGVLERDAPSEDEVDPNSPMERKVLHWIVQSPFYQRHQDQIELLPQFPVGEYLRQLDPSYVYPSYRVDFLLRYRTADDSVFNIVVEYDGFQEHFVEHGKIHEGNWERYYRPEDVERQMVLESYGYKFMRINRFNLGEDPASSVSERLYGLVEAAEKEERSGVIARIQQQVQGQEEGSLKVCPKCRELRPLEAFFDPKLKGGAGGHGRICMPCKRGQTRSAASATTGPSRPSGRSYRRWRRRK